MGKQKLTSLLILVSIPTGIALLMSAFLFYDFADYVGQPHQIRSDAPLQYRKVQLPHLRGLIKPKAILVMDVSGSMNRNDPDLLQATAVRQFFDIYRDLSKEVLPDGQRAQIAVVLFSTVAQIIDWGNGRHLVWLDVCDKNSEIFHQTVSRFLGSDGKDPRKGQDTDYLDALMTLNTLLSDIKEPPAVIFLTDGQYDPHPAFNAKVFTPSLKGKQWLHSYIQKHRFIDHVQGKILNRLDLDVGGRKEKIPPQRADAKGMQHYVTALSEEIARTAKTIQSFQIDGRPDIRPTFSSIYLSNSSEAFEQFKRLFADSTHSDPVDEKTSVIPCRTADEMVNVFVQAVASWLGMEEQPLAPNPGGRLEFNVPSEVTAFAIQVRTANNIDALELKHKDVVLPLAGSLRDWAGVGKITGKWATNSGVRVIDGRLFFRPRYKWFLNTPERVKNMDTGSIKVYLSLYSLEKKEPVRPQEVLSRVPQSLQGNVIYPNASNKRILFNLEPEGYAYAASLDISGAGSGKAYVSISKDVLSAVDVNRTNSGVAQEVVLEPYLSIRLKTDNGTYDSIGISGVPRKWQWMKHGFFFGK
jgi:hypothetical protein